MVKPVIGDVVISIHTPLAGSDGISGDAEVRVSFQSTLPLRGATTHCRVPELGEAISIHTPLAGSDAGGRGI